MSYPNACKPVSALLKLKRQVGVKGCLQARLAYGEVAGKEVARAHVRPIVIKARKERRRIDATIEARVLAEKVLAETRNRPYAQTSP